jgi:hypothetical protein
MTFDAGSRDTDLYHLDADLQNNRIDNLRPMTRAQFTQHEYRKQASIWLGSINTTWMGTSQTFDNCRMAKLAIGDAKDDPSLGIHIRDKSGPYKGFVYGVRDHN